MSSTDTEIISRYISLPERILRMAQSYPRREAVADSERTLNYQELCLNAWQLALQMKMMGIKSGDRVAYCLDRSVDIAIAPLASMFCGAVFIPLDPQHPMTRTHHIIEDSELSVVITQKQYVERFKSEDINTILIETMSTVYGSVQSILDDTRYVARANDACYAMFTSGTTGRPKGVSISHGALSHCLRMHAKRPGCDSGSRVLALTTVTFDPMFFDIFLPLTVGGFSYIADYATSLDPKAIAKTIEAEKINQMYSVPTRWKMLFDYGWKPPKKFIAWSGAEVLTTHLAKQFWDHDVTLWNSYGPTETTISVTVEEVTKDLARITIGRAVDGVELYVLDKDRKPVEMEESGELYVGGLMVGNGYFKRPEETTKAFINDPDISESTLYKTGDLVRQLSDGRYEFLGRADSQVKIRGLRIELSEIEQVLLSIEGVRDVVVDAKDVNEEKQLIGYLITESQVSTTQVREHLMDQLPAYMIPAHFIYLDAFPLNTNRKIDRKKLPLPSLSRPELDVPYVQPESASERALAEVWLLCLQIDRVGTQDNFFDLGGTSLLAVEVSSVLAQQYHITLPVVKLFEYQSIAAIAAYLDYGEEHDVTLTMTSMIEQPLLHNEPIAIIGMACRMPGADTVDEYWDNLIQGKETIQRFSAEQIDASHADLLSNKHYVPARGIVEDADCFDATFFAMNPREAEFTDPQQRLLLQEAWHALEDAGIIPGETKESVGVFVGTSKNTYFSTVAQKRPDLIEAFGENNLIVATEKDYSATRLSHKLNLTGPSVSIHTACSTAMVAAHQAVQSLRMHDCDIALAGAATINAPLQVGYEYNEGGMYSADGHCKPFSDQASGTVFSDGVGVVVLRRLSDAVRDGDRIYAVIKGSAINNDGANKMSFSAPSVKGQANVVAMAQHNAHVNPAEIDYVEAHGTGTPLGDPIEVEALTAAFNRDGKLSAKKCGLGSAKSNFGHLNAAAGIAGLIKATLSLYHGEVPATLHYEKPNPQIDFSKTPFHVINKNWTLPVLDRPACIGVSALGVGGTNAHMVLQANDVSSSKEVKDANEATEFPQLLVLSAKTEQALTEQRKQLANFVKRHPDTNSADMAFTLHLGRKKWSQRQSFVVYADNIVARVEQPSPVFASRGDATQPSMGVALMFPGQGSQYAGMGASLYAWHPIYQQAIDACHSVLKSKHGLDLKGLLTDKLSKRDEITVLLQQTQYTQPAIFAVAYATAKLWLHLGVKVEAMLGHSVGEFVAAHLAGVFTLEDALHLVAVRGQMMQELPPGSMLSVKASESDIKPYLKGDVSIAAINAPGNCVVAGPAEEIDKVHEQLLKQDFFARPLLTSHAFHSSMMNPIVEPFLNEVVACSLGDASIPIMSTVTGKWLTSSQAKDPYYWAEHLRAPVRFADAVGTLLSSKAFNLLECGPRGVCTSLTKPTLQALVAEDNECMGGQSQAFASLGAKGEIDAEHAAFLLAAGNLWVQGIEVDPYVLNAGQSRQRISLPGYPFAKDKHWIDVGEHQLPVVTKSPQRDEPALVVSAETQPDLGQAAGEEKITVFRIEQILQKMADVLEKSSGIEINEYPADTDFIDIGLDSLLLTEAALNLRKAFGVDLSFSQLLQQLYSPQLLAEYLDQELPDDEFQPAAVAPEPVVAAQSTLMPALNMSSAPIQGEGVNAVIAQQLQLMQQQLAMLLGGGQAPAQTDAAQSSVVSSPATVSKDVAVKPVKEKAKKDKPFGAQAKIQKNKTAAFTPKQLKAYEAFRDAYVHRTPKSRLSTIANRAHLADPRVVTGFNPDIKDLVYSVVVDKSQGAMLWDIDGNEYIDLTGGFGCSYMGHRHPVVVEAVEKQLKAGYEIGPQHPLAGEVAGLLCDLTGMERAAFCNTGSEAVMGAMRLARTVTGKAKIVTFSGDYHGIFDEVIVRSAPNGRVFPAASGILPEAVANSIVLPYGEDASLQVIRDNLDDIAAIMIEPIQSRTPTLQPKEFVRALREIATEADIPMIFDEIITGFRMGMGGAQEFYGVKADIATYGKVIGGGLPVGAIVGQAKYLDALDGGQWQYGDDSIPEVGVTYFAGTFVRHPLALAATKATLEFMKEQGEEVLAKTNAQTQELVTTLNEHFKSHDIPINIVYFSSLFRVEIDAPEPIPSLYYYRLLYHGLHVWLGRNLFLTVAHTDEHVMTIFDVFVKVADEMIAAGFIKGKSSEKKIKTKKSNGAPADNARLGKDKNGNPAWFVPDPEKPGAFKKVADA